MQISFKLLIIGVAAWWPCWTGPARSQEPAILVESGSTERLPLDHVLSTGRDLRGRYYQIIVDRKLSTGVVSIMAHLNGRALGVVHLRPRDFERLDLGALKLESSQRADLIVTLRYGNLREGCFYNDDGRDIVSVHFSTRRRPEIYPESLQPVCNQNIRE